MKLVNIGTILSTQKYLTLNIDTLLKSRLLVQASSGGGKTYAIRKIVEQTNGSVQQIILDVEDDFSTLREKFDFVLVGRGGDIAADPRSAEMLAKKLLELQADTIINLYELKQHERIRFVKLFLSAMIDAPKELWHPCMVILDEAHMFAPEKAKAESLGAVIDMASRGRKRGFCLIPATQRPAKLHKDVTAECQNKMIGLANQDIDRKRGAEELGFTEKEKVLALRDLNEGEFFAVGPAFGRGVEKVKISQVKTTHHEAGKVFKRNNKPVATKKVQAILAKLNDLPREMEEEKNLVESLHNKIRELGAELRRKQGSTISPEDVQKIQQAAMQNARVEAAQAVLRMLEPVRASVVEVFKTLQSINTKLPVPKVGPSMGVTPAEMKHIARVVEVHKKAQNGEFGKCERAILKFLAMRRDRAFNKTQIGVMTGYSAGSGGFNNALSKLAQNGLIVRSGDRIAIYEDRIEDVKSILGNEFLSSEPDALLGWLNKLGKCERTVFEIIRNQPENNFTKDELGRVTGYSSGSGGFNNALSKLNTLGLVQRNQDGTITVNQEVLGL